MKSCLTKEEYKKHRFPFPILLYYLLNSIICITLTEFLAIGILKIGLEDFWDNFAAIIVMLLAGGVLWFLSCVIFTPNIINIIRNDKSYRGIGLKLFIKLLLFLIPVSFVLFILILNLANVEYSFFNIVTIFIEFTIPFLITINTYSAMKRFKKIGQKHPLYVCKKCGLINTYVETDTSYYDLGTKHKFHNEGGYRHTWKSPYGVIVQDVPTTTVYDGEFKKTSLDIHCACSVCKETAFDSQTTEIRID